MTRRDGEERRRIAVLVAVFIAALIAGAVMGWLVRRSSHPTLEERARGAAQEMSDTVHKMTR